MQRNIDNRPLKRFYTRAKRVKGGVPGGPFVQKRNGYVNFRLFSRPVTCPGCFVNPRLFASPKDRAGGYLGLHELTWRGSQTASG